MDDNFGFRFAERCLYDYLENVARLEALRVELRALDSLSSVRVQTYDGIPGNGEPQDTVSACLEKLERIEQYMLLLSCENFLPLKRFLQHLECPLQ